MHMQLRTYRTRQSTDTQLPPRYKECTVKCDSEEELMSHYHTHPKRQYQCSECPMSFDDKIVLSQHTAVHTGEKKYQCEYCDKKFTTQLNRTSHILVHTGEKNFKCASCGKSFSLNGNLTKHIKAKVCQK